MANVDPFVIDWPAVWLEDPEIGPVVQYLNRFLHDLWARTGGGADAIEAAQNPAIIRSTLGLFTELQARVGDLERRPQLAAQVADLRRRIETPRTDAFLLGQLEEVRDLVRSVPRHVARQENPKSYQYDTAVSVTTTGSFEHEIVNCTNSSPTNITITLQPVIEGQLVTVPRSGTGGVTVDGNGAETINGDANVVIVAQYDAPTFRGTSSEWVIV